MEQLSDKARALIKSQAKTDVFYGEMFNLATSQLYALVSEKIPSTEKKQVLIILRQALYINLFLVWKLSTFVWERRTIDAELKHFQEKISWANDLIVSYNDAVKSSVNFILVNVVNAAAKNIVPITVFKSGKMQLRNRDIQREKKKLFNKHKKRLYMHYVVARVTEDFIQSNNLTEFINDNIISSIEELKSPTIMEYELKTDIPKDDYEYYKIILFDDLTHIERWQEDFWGY